MTEKIKTKKVKKVKIKNKNKLVSNIIVNVNSNNKKKVRQIKKESQGTNPIVITNNPPQYNPYIQPQIQQPQLIQNDIGLGVHRSLEGLQTRIQVLFDEQEHQRNAHQRDLQHRDDTIRNLLIQQRENKIQQKEQPNQDYGSYGTNITPKAKHIKQRIPFAMTSDSEGDYTGKPVIAQKVQSVSSFKQSRTDTPQSRNLYDYYEQTEINDYNKRSINDSRQKDTSTKVTFINDTPSFIPISERSKISSSPTHDMNKSTPKQVNFTDDNDFSKPVPKSTIKPNHEELELVKILL